MPGPDAGVAAPRKGPVFQWEDGEKVDLRGRTKSEIANEVKELQRQNPNRRGTVTGGDAIEGLGEKMRPTYVPYVPKKLPPLAGPSDAGVPADAGAPDAGPFDAGARRRRGPQDAGAIVDAAKRVRRVVDAGSTGPRDAGAGGDDYLIVEFSDGGHRQISGSTPAAIKGQFQQLLQEAGPQGLSVIDGSHGAVEATSVTGRGKALADEFERYRARHDGGLPPPITPAAPASDYQAVYDETQRKYGKDGGTSRPYQPTPTSPRDAGARRDWADEFREKDAGLRDAGGWFSQSARDAGVRDAGVRRDGGLRDAGVGDAGRDAGRVTGGLDAGLDSGVDAGRRVSSPPSSLAVDPLARPPRTAATHWGARVPGNIDLRNRPHVKNADGSISTVRSIGVEFDGKQFLIPSVSDDGRVLSDDEAIKEFYRTGRHLGIYDSPEDSTAAADAIHKDQEKNPPRDTLGGRGLRPKALDIDVGEPGGVVARPAKPAPPMRAEVVDQATGDKISIGHTAQDIARYLEFLDQHPRISPQRKGSPEMLKLLDDARARDEQLRQEDEARAREQARQRQRMPVLDATELDLGTPAEQRAMRRHYISEQMVPPPKSTDVPGPKVRDQFKHWATIRGADGQPIEIGGNSPKEIEDIFNGEVKREGNVQIVEADPESWGRISPRYRMRAQQEAGTDAAPAAEDAAAQESGEVPITRPSKKEKAPAQPDQESGDVPIALPVPSRTEAPKGSLRQRAQDAGAIVRGEPRDAGAPVPKQPTLIGGQEGLGNIAREFRDAGAPVAEDAGRPMTTEEIIARDEALDREQAEKERQKEQPLDAGMKAIADAGKIVADAGGRKKVPRDAGADAEWSMDGPIPNAPISDRDKKPEPIPNAPIGDRNKKPAPAAPIAPPAAAVPPKKGPKLKPSKPVDPRLTPNEQTDEIANEQERQAQLEEQRAKDTEAAQKARAEEWERLRQQRAGTAAEARDVYRGSRESKQSLEARMRFMIDDIAEREKQKPFGARDVIMGLITAAIAAGGKPGSGLAAKIMSDVLPTSAGRWARELEADQGKLAQLQKHYGLTGHGASQDIHNQATISSLAAGETAAALERMAAVAKSEDDKNALLLEASRTRERAKQHARALSVEEVNRQQLDLMNRMSAGELEYLDARNELGTEGQAVLARKKKEQREELQAEANRALTDAKTAYAQRMAQNGPRPTEMQQRYDTQVADVQDALHRVGYQLYHNGAAPPAGAFVFGDKVAMLSPELAQWRADVLSMLDAPLRAKTGAGMRENEFADEVGRRGLTSPYESVRINAVRQLVKSVRSMDVLGRLKDLDYNTAPPNAAQERAQMQHGAQPTAPTAPAEPMGPPPAPLSDAGTGTQVAPPGGVPPASSAASAQPTDVPYRPKTGLASADSWPRDKASFNKNELATRATMQRRIERGETPELYLYRADNSFVTKMATSMEVLAQALELGYSLTPRPAALMIVRDRPDAGAR